MDVVGCIYLVVGSRVAKSMFSANTPARDNRFNNDDLPATESHDRGLRGIKNNQKVNTLPIRG